MQLTGRYVHCDRHQRRALLAPVGHVGSDPPQHEVANGNDQAGLFGDWNEARRTKCILLSGSFQRTSASSRDDAPRLDFDQRLVVNFEFQHRSAARKLASMATRSFSLRSMIGLKTWKLLRPRSLA